MTVGLGSTHVFWDGADHVYVAFGGRDAPDGYTWDSRHLFAVAGATRTYFGSILPQPERGIASFRLPAETTDCFEIWDSVLGQPRCAVRVHLIAGGTGIQADPEKLVRAKLDLFLQRASNRLAFHLSLLPAWNDVNEQTVQQLDFYHELADHLLLETVIGTSKLATSADDQLSLSVWPAESFFSHQRYVVYVRSRRQARVLGSNGDPIITAFQSVILSEDWEAPGVELLLEAPAAENIRWQTDIAIFTISHLHETLPGLIGEGEPVLPQFGDFVRDTVSQMGNVPRMHAQQMKFLYSLNMLSRFPHFQGPSVRAGTSQYIRVRFDLPWLAPGDRFGIIVRRPAAIDAGARSAPGEDVLTDVVVLRYLVRGAVQEPVTRASLADDPFLRFLLSKGISLLNSTPESIGTIVENQMQRRSSAEVRDAWTAALGVDLPEGPESRQMRRQLDAMAPAQLYDLLSSRGLLSKPPPFTSDLLNLFVRAPGLFRFAHLAEEWVTALSRAPAPALDPNELFFAVWVLALPGAPRPERWDMPSAVIGFLELTQYPDLLERCLKLKLFPTPAIVNADRIRLLLGTIEDDAWWKELEKAQAHVDGIATWRTLGTEWTSLEWVEKSINDITARKAAEVEAAQWADRIGKIYFSDIEVGDAGDEVEGTQEELTDELLANMPAGATPAKRQELIEELQAAGLSGLRKLVATIREDRRRKTWPQKAGHIIQALESWSGVHDFAIKYTKVQPAAEAVKQLVAFKLREWPDDSGGRLGEIKQSLVSQIRKIIPGSISGEVTTVDLETYAKLLANRRIADSIDRILDALTPHAAKLPTPVARGLSTVRILRQAFPYGTNAAVARLDQLLREMAQSGDAELVRLAGENELKISAPDLAQGLPAEPPPAGMVTVPSMMTSET